MLMSFRCYMCVDKEVCISTHLYINIYIRAVLCRNYDYILQIIVFKFHTHHCVCVVCMHIHVCVCLWYYIHMLQKQQLSGQQRLQIMTLGSSIVSGALAS